MSGLKRAVTGLAAALAASCAGKPSPAPPAAPPPAPAPPAASTPAAPAPRPVQDWPDRPLSAGDWSYRADAGGGSEARYAGFGLRCDAQGRRIHLFREGSAGAVRVRTSYGERAVGPGEALAAADTLLDEMAFSRGRFAVEADGAETLIVPTWAEAARVVEDCRG